MRKRRIRGAVGAVFLVMTAVSNDARAEPFDIAIAAFEQADYETAARNFLAVARDPQHPKYGKAIVNLGVMAMDGAYFERDLVSALMFLSLGGSRVNTAKDRNSADVFFREVGNQLREFERIEANWRIRYFGRRLDALENARRRIPEGFWAYTNDPRGWDRDQIVEFGNAAYWAGIEAPEFVRCGRQDLLDAIDHSFAAFNRIFPPSLQDRSQYDHRYLRSRFDEGRRDHDPSRHRESCDALPASGRASERPVFNLDLLAPVFTNVRRIARFHTTTVEDTVRVFRPK